MTAEPAPLFPVPTTGPRICSGGCGRQIINRTLWAKFTDQERKNLGRTHARYQGDGMCCTCYRHHHPTPNREPLDLAWPEEGWVTVRGIRRRNPDYPRPVDKDPTPSREQLVDLFAGFTTLGES